MAVPLKQRMNKLQLNGCGIECKVSGLQYLSSPVDGGSVVEEVSVVEDVSVVDEIPIYRRKID